jgi:hypothetical protein
LSGQGQEKFPKVLICATPCGGGECRETAIPLTAALRVCRSIVGGLAQPHFLAARETGKQKAEILTQCQTTGKRRGVLHLRVNHPKNGKASRVIPCRLGLSVTAPPVCCRRLMSGAGGLCRRPFCKRYPEAQGHRRCPCRGEQCHCPATATTRQPTASPNIRWHSVKRARNPCGRRHGSHEKVTSAP